MTETTSRPSTWRDVTADAYLWAVDALARGDLDPADEDNTDRWITETAGGCEHVTWYDNAWSLWRDLNAPAWDEDPEPSTDPDKLLTAYAVHAVEVALREAVDALTGPDAPTWGLCRACGMPVCVEDDPHRGALVVEVRSGDDGGTYDWCNTSDDHAHHRASIVHHAA